MPRIKMKDLNQLKGTMGEGKYFVIRKSYLYDQTILKISITYYYSGACDPMGSSVFLVKE